MSSITRGLAISALALTALACGPGAGVYCQSGPKYGTECYSEADVRNPPGEQRPHEEPPRKGEPPSTPPPNRVKW
jgi:hypothetical protein